MGSPSGVMLCQGSRQRSWACAGAPILLWGQFWQTGRDIIRYRLLRKPRASARPPISMDEAKQKAGWLTRGNTRIPDLGSTHKPQLLLPWWQPMGLALLCLPRWTGCERYTLPGWRPSSLALLHNSQQLHQWFHCTHAEELLWSRAQSSGGVNKYNPTCQSGVSEHVPISSCTLVCFPGLLHNTRPPLLTHLCSPTFAPGGDRKTFFCL